MKSLEGWKDRPADLGNLGAVAITRGDLDAAEDYHKRALAIDEKLGRLEGQAKQAGKSGPCCIHTRRSGRGGGLLAAGAGLGGIAASRSAAMAPH